MLDGLWELMAAWLSRRRARAAESARALPGPAGPPEGEAEARPSNRLPPALATVQDWRGEDGEFLSAEKQRESLLATVQQCSSHRGGLARQVRHGMQVSRKGGGTAVPFVEWDSRWQRPFVGSGDPVDRAETWAAAVEAEAPEVVEQNRARARMRSAGTRTGDA